MYTKYHIYTEVNFIYIYIIKSKKSFYFYFYLLKKKILTDNINK